MIATLNRILPKNIQFSFVALVGIVVAVIGLLIVPLPPIVLDTFIAFNITISILLLLSVLYIEKPLDFSTFPTVLLLSTLLRLAISIATTRLILGEAEGGDIIQQFGEMVAGGQLIVGLVVFLIITVVQFIVIAKGAERVAEVAARFSLDAMPGKHLSIDSDLRSGLITKEDAKQKRRTVEMESRLYGSLDGAMKFVKGDAIASIIIVIVNLLGGFAIGALSHGMSMSESIQTFSILSIGDGLVAQIPALFSAMAAGLLVTRTTDEETERELGPAIARQLAGKPHVLIIGGSLALAMGLIPGFPLLVFAGIALLLIGGGVVNHPEWGAGIRKRFSAMRGETQEAPQEIVLETTALKSVDPLQLRLAKGAFSPEQLADLTAAVQRRAQELQDKSGVGLPKVRVMLESEMPTNGWALYAYDAPLGSGELEPQLFEAQLPLITGELMRRNLPMFLGLQEVTDLLNWLGDEYPEVVKEAVRAVPTSTIAEILRLLVEEQVPLRNLRDAVEAIAEAGQMERDPRIIAERVRVALRRNIIAPLCVNGRLPVLMVGSAVEEAIRNTVTMIDGQARLAIDPYQMRALILLLTEQVEATGARAILTAQDLRRPLRLVTAADLFDVPVISFNELNPAIPLDVVGEVNRAPELLGQHDVAEAAE